LLSGCAALVYQVVWFRMCNRAFGATAPAVATVLAVFMAGLGLGAHFAGRRADAYAPRRCLEAYALLELGIAGLALLTPWVLGALPDVHAFAARHAGHGAFVGTLIRVIASAGALLPPTLLMGATLPLLLRGSEPAPAELTRSIGRLYTANNLGAVLGTLLSGFVLLRELGEIRTVQCAAVLNLAAAGLVLLGRSRAPAPRAAP
jgi:spermidine synthase